MHTRWSISRRRFLRNTLAFSAASALVGCSEGGSFFDTHGVVDAVTDQPSHFLAVGDWGTFGTEVAQSSVATGMQTYAKLHSITADALLMLGDNFYGDLPGGERDSRWQSQFEQMYPASAFNCPAFAVPGNHDYQYSPQSKYNAELAYPALNPTRWTMPSRYYRFTYPAVNPVITFIMLDSNMINEPAQPWPPPDPSYYAQSDTQRQEQLAWLADTLNQPLTTPFLAFIAHHPLYSNGPHGDNQTLIRDWDPLLRKHNVHLYMGGHDHDLQHLEFAGHPTSFVLSGAGGAGLNQERSEVASRGPFFDEVHGFTHLQVRSDLMIVRHLDVHGYLLHKFTKTPDGTVTILK